MKFRKRKRPEVEVTEPVAEVQFDFASRHEFLTGFRKRKQERRRLAITKALERERTENIQVRKEYREDVKAKWKEVQWADRHMKKLLAARKLALSDGRSQPAIENKEPAPELADGGVEYEDEGGDVMEAEGETPQNAKNTAAVTVSFEVEDDDPFGGCEVTATAADDVSGGSQWPLSLQPTPVTCRELVRVRGTRGGKKNKKKSVEEDIDDLDEEAQERNRRRAESLAKEEARRLAALAKRVRRTIALKDKAKKKGKKKKASKNKKAGAKARRRRK